ncbi:hypothetical protein, partial [uncultured Lamprocystis sp.]
QRALSTLQRRRFCRVDKRSASTISLAHTLLTAATPNLELLSRRIEARARRAALSPLSSTAA